MRALTNALRARSDDGRSPLIAIDQEGGRVARLTDGVEAMPSMMALGAAGDLELAGRAGEQIAFDLRRAGCTLAVATDCNPGSAWCESMPYAVQLACLGMGLGIDEALRAATLGGARALRRDDVGHLAVGASADLAILTSDHEADLVAHLGAPAVAATVIGGVVA